MADYEGSEEGELLETSPPGRDRVHASPVLTRQDRGGSAHRSGGGPVERPVDATEPPLCSDYTLTSHGRGVWPLRSLLYRNKKLAKFLYFEDLAKYFKRG